MHEKCINVFDLHLPKEDVKPTSWICIGGKGVRKIVHDILQEIIMSEKPTIYVDLEPIFRKDIIRKCVSLCGNQRELGKRLNISQQEISKWHLGMRNMPLISVNKMATMAKIPLKKVKMKSVQKKYDYKKTISKFSLSRELAKRLDCSSDVVWRSFSRDYVPIPVILEMLELWRKKTKRGDSEVKKTLNEMNHAAESLKLNNPISKPIKAVRNLNSNLCKLIGAFAADGNLYLEVKLSSLNKKEITEIKNNVLGKESKTSLFFDKGRKCYFFKTSNQESINKIKNMKFARNIWISYPYKLTLREQYEDSVMIFSGWCKDVFGIRSIAKKDKDKNSWFVTFTNKIIGRYMKVVFGFPAGKKSHNVDEPSIIKKSRYEHRKAFALGVMTFDGSVSLDERLRLMVKSKNLRDSIADILSKEFGMNNLTMGLTNRKEYYLTTKANIPIEILMKYVEEVTAKHKRLRTFLNMHKISYDDIDKELHNLGDGSYKLMFMDILKILKKEKAIDIYSIQKIVKNDLRINVSKITIYRILKVLNKTQFVNIEKKKVYHKTASYMNIYKFSGVSNENR